MRRSEDISYNKIKIATIDIILLYIIAVILIISGISDHKLLYAGGVLLFFTLIATNGLIKKRRQFKISHIEHTAKRKSHPISDYVNGIHEGLHHMNFNLDGTSSPETQKILYDLSVNEGFFKTIDSVEFEPFDRAGTINYRVIINKKFIGNIPHEYTKEFEQYQSMPMEVAMIDVFGGEIHSDGHSLPYSCRIVLRFKVDTD